MIDINTDNICGISPAMIDVVRVRFVIEPNMQISIPITVAANNKRCSNAKFSFSAKMELFNASIRSLIIALIFNRYIFC